ncbi:hypothetical protein CH35J_002406 [Colletotrichum higginsianum]|uniref:Uncharacterized protein n=1 Tax=Colletotrichum higginsianum TaxID=80884 RepID=A0A4T0WE30_9PEZI|nr:hypothetical protein CH35J_002406 [Colletotrichum higginsianum]
MESGSPEEEDRLASVLSVQRQVHLQQHQPQPLASPQYPHQLHRQANFDSHYDYRETDFDLESDPDPYRRRSDSSSHQSHHHYLPSSPVTNAFARENLDASAAHTAGASAAVVESPPSNPFFRYRLHGDLPISSPRQPVYAAKRQCQRPNASASASRAYRRASLTTIGLRSHRTPCRRTEDKHEQEAECQGLDPEIRPADLHACDAPDSRPRCPDTFEQNWHERR